MEVTKLNVPQWKEPDIIDIARLNGEINGKQQLWNKLPVEWTTSEKGLRLWREICEENAQIFKEIDESTIMKDYLSDLNKK